MVSYLESLSGMIILLALAGVIIIFCVNYLYGKHDYVWHDKSEMPERESEISNISEDLIIFNLRDSVEVHGYFDFEKNEFLDKYGETLDFHYFNWRYRFYNV